jgi:hypothetical protein
MLKQIALLILSSMLLVMAGCGRENENEEECGFGMEHEERIARSWYAMVMHFYGYRNWLGIDEFTAVIFVHSEEENVDYPETVSVTWPTEITHNIVFLINREVRRVGIDLEELGLQYPVTIEDMVDSWEKIDYLTTRVISNVSWRIIRSHARRFTLEELIEWGDEEPVEVVVD